MECGIGAKETPELVLEIIGTANFHNTMPKLKTGRFKTRKELVDFVRDQYYRVRTRTITEIANDARISAGLASLIIDGKAKQ